MRESCLVGSISSFPFPSSGLLPEILAVPYQQLWRSAAIERSCRREGYWSPFLDGVVAIDLASH